MKKQLTLMMVMGGGHMRNVGLCCLMIVALTQTPSKAGDDWKSKGLAPEAYLAEAGDLAEKVKADIAKCTDLNEGRMKVGKPGERKVGFVPAKGQLERLFGGVKAKYFLFEVKGEERTVSVVDFSAPQLKSEKLFAHKYGATYGGAPSVSKDGTRLTYLDGNEIVISELKKDAPNRTVFSTSGFDPCWWVHPKTGDEYIIWASTPCDTEQEGTGERGRSTKTIAEGIKGKTFIRKVKKGTCQPDGPVKTLSDTYAFRCGRSADGKYICTGQPGWGIAELKPDAVEDAFVKVISTVDLSAYDVGPRSNMLIVDKAKRGKVFVIDPSNNSSMGQIPANANGYTVVNSSWHNYSEYLAFFMSKQLAKPVGSFLYNPSTGKFFMMTVNTEGPVIKPVKRALKTPAELWVDPQGKPSFPEPTATAKIMAEWDKALVAAGKKEFAAKQAIKKGAIGVN